MRKLHFTDAALVNIADIAAYVAENSGSIPIGERFAARLAERCAQLASLPGRMGRERAELLPAMRSSAFRGYIIFFRYVDDAFEVVAIVEGHRDIAAYFNPGGE